MAMGILHLVLGAAAGGATTFLLLRLMSLRKGSDPFEKMAHFLLAVAANSSSKEIVFGTPTEPFDEVTEDGLPLTRPSGPLSEEESEWWEWYEAHDEATITKVHEMLTTDVFPYLLHCGKAMPIWYGTEGNYRKEQDFPCYILADVINAFINGAGREVVVSTTGQPSYSVKYSVGLKDNYCYFVRLEEVNMVAE